MIGTHTRRADDWRRIGASWFKTRRQLHDAICAALRSATGDELLTFAISHDDRGWQVINVQSVDSLEGGQQ